MSCLGMQGRPADLKAGKVVGVAIFILCMETNLNSAPAPFKLSAEHFLKILEQKVDNVRAGTGGNARPEESVPAEASFTGFRNFLADDVRRMTRIVMASPNEVVFPGPDADVNFEGGHRCSAAVFDRKVQCIIA